MSTNTVLTDLLRKQQSSRAAPCVLITSPEAVTEQISASDLENASNRAASFLEQELREDDTTFFYMGPSDMRYFIWVLAAMKTERCVGRALASSCSPPPHTCTHSMHT